MEGVYLIYFLLGALLFWGSKCCFKGEWNEEYTSLRQTKMLEGAAALGVVLHDAAQKTCAPWRPSYTIVHGLDPFVEPGYVFVAVFFFCSGLGLYKSVKTKPDYLKGFFRRRMLPVIVAFYLSEWIYLLIRLGMGEKMGTADILWYLSGLRLANMNAWFMVVLPLFYLFFYLAFRFCRRDGAAIVWVFIGVMLYTVGCAFVDHQDVWWIRGEWWYNSVLLFPLGMLFAKHEGALTGIIRKRYILWLAAGILALIAVWTLSDIAVARWGYYGENWRDPLRVLHRLGSAASQWLVCIAAVSVCMLLLMKVRFGNRALGWLGKMSMDVYLCHGVFVELFWFDFLGRKSLYYIRSVPAYLGAVLLCGLAAAAGFRLLRTEVMKLPAAVCAAGQKVPAAWKRIKNKRALFIAAALILAVVSGWVMLLPRQGGNVRRINGIEVRIPEGFSCTFSERDHSVWTYGRTDKKPGPLILDAGIRGSRAQVFVTAEDVAEDCGWMEDMEIYINPRGIRTVRGHSTDYAGGREYRYYVETPKTVFLIAMSENPAYYDAADCEAVLKETVDGMVPAGAR